jgi:predicted transcriptional regulator
LASTSSAATAEFVMNSTVRLGLLRNLITGPKSPSQLATIEKRHVSHVSRALSELRSRGIVEQMPGASRETLYRLTTQGYVVYTALSRAR